MMDQFLDRRKHARFVLEDPLQVSVRHDEEFSGWHQAHILDMV